MAVEIIDKLKPKNGGSFPLMDAEDILLPETYDYDEQTLINNIIECRRRGKKHHIIKGGLALL